MQETKLADADAPLMTFKMARLRAGPPRRRPLERRRHRDPAAARDRRRRHQLRRRAGPQQRPRRRRATSRGGLQPVRRGADARAPSVDGHPLRQPLRAQRPRRRLAVLRRQARAGTSGSRAGSTRRAIRRAARRRRRLEHRADRRRRLGRAAPSTAAPTSRQPEREAFAALLELGARRRLPVAPAGAGPLHAGGTTGPATSTRTWACASTTCCSTRPLAERVVWAEIDREARKGTPIPSDHAPLFDRPRRAGRAVRRRLGGRRAGSPRAGQPTSGPRRASRKRQAPDRGNPGAHSRRRSTAPPSPTPTASPVRMARRPRRSRQSGISDRRAPRRPAPRSQDPVRLASTIAAGPTPLPSRLRRARSLERARAPTARHHEHAAGDRAPCCGWCRVDDLAGGRAPRRPRS